jgi:hypothetical protein
MDGYDIAQICLNGHVTTSMARSYPEFKKAFCDECGERTIMKCPTCQTDIKGDYHMEGVIGGPSYEEPKFCDSCGSAFPWTDRRTAAAKELIEVSDNLTVTEKEDFKKCIDDLVKSGPASTVAQAKYKKYIGKVGSEIGKGMREILIDIVSESVRKTMFP